MTNLTCSKYIRTDGLKKFLCYWWYVTLCWVFVLVQPFWQLLIIKGITAGTVHLFPVTSSGELLIHAMLLEIAVGTENFSSQKSCRSRWNMFTYIYSHSQPCLHIMPEFWHVTRQVYYNSLEQCIKWDDLHLHNLYWWVLG